MSKLLQRSMFGNKGKWVSGGEREFSGTPISGFETYYLDSIHPLRTSEQSTRILGLLYRIKVCTWSALSTYTGVQQRWTISRIRR